MILIKSFWCPRHLGKSRRHKIKVYAAEEDKKSPRKGEAKIIFVRVN